MSSSERQSVMMETFKAIYGMSETNNPVQILGPIFYLPESNTCVIHAPEGFYDKDSAWEASFLVRELNAKKAVDPIELEFDFVTNDRRTTLKYKSTWQDIWFDTLSIGKVSGGWRIEKNPTLDYSMLLQAFLNVVKHHRKNHNGN